ncbi:LOW QUALITY PROTEIN: Uncharacterized protein PHPALM_3859 [Phytophthora palmivora]|uniref:CCHC-type domain-containing protein n=1 Tax=Phytophthora palmivora TaxID=4796 RepID=A0A2P4YLA2_9STRA|nr:LOW QUALITY PROTEIN: Uncharacterized protein PHPALM_3859 [Phytophthora palmivora]
MDLSNVAVIRQQRNGGNVRCSRCGHIGHYAREFGAGCPTGNAVTCVNKGHEMTKVAAPSERDSHCKILVDKSYLAILTALVDSGASSNIVQQQNLQSLDFEEVNILELDERLATDAVVKTEKRVIRSGFSYKHRVFVGAFIVLELDDKFDMVLDMPWLARHDPVIDWNSARSIVYFGRGNATESGSSVNCMLREVNPKRLKRATHTAVSRRSARVVPTAGLIRTNRIRRETPPRGVEMTTVCRLRELTHIRYQHGEGSPTKGVAVAGMRRLQESTL